MKSQLSRTIGVLGLLVIAILFVHQPSFPTPDKILIFLTCLFMALGEGWSFFKRLAPFAALILVYDSFRGIADSLNTHVNYTFMIHADKLLGFGSLPTAALQNWLWQGHLTWYDYLIYLFYMLHFVLPFGLALVIWKKREAHYWRYVTTFLLVSFAGFITFVLFPAAPPWLASDHGYIPRITHIAYEVWHSLGIQDFPSLYNQISPNIVAAMPSLHAAYATLVAIFSVRLFHKWWRWLVVVYPLMIYFGTVYTGEHYIIDEVAGGLYALGAYLATPWVLRKLKQIKIFQFRR